LVWAVSDDKQGCWIQMSSSQAHYEKKQILEVVR
jgi:hypothetical protein